MVDVSEKWTCPNSWCLATWSRDRQSLDSWLTAIRAVQAAHGPRCAKRAGKK